MIRSIVVILFVWVASMVNVCQAKVCTDSLGQSVHVGTEMPDFHKCFRRLAQNRDIYNLYNDSIFLIKDHDQWVTFFRHRALKNHQLFATNKVIISEVLDYFKQDKKHIPQEAYHSLLQGLHRLFAENKMDPFLGNDFADILLDYYNGGECPDSLNYSGLVDYYKGCFYWEMYILGQEKFYAEKSYEYFKRSIGKDRYKSPSYTESCLMSIENLTMTNWLVRKMQTIGEYRSLISDMEDLLKLPRTTRILSEGDYKIYDNLLKYTDEKLIRNVYLADTTVLDKQYADSLMSALVEKNLNDPKLSDLSYTRTLLMQIKLGQITAEEAVGKMDSIYVNVRKRIYSGERFDFRQLIQLLQPYMNFFYINDIANISFAQKRLRVKKLAKDIVVIFQHRRDQQGNNNYVKTLNLYASYPRAIKYLTEEERIHYLNQLNVATQVTTYAHSAHVARIARVLMRGILKYRPKLLVGALGDKWVKDVKKHSRNYLEFIQEAGLYHDLGKNAIITVVNNDYRPLTDKEFDIIKTHPAKGAELLKIAPSLYKKYRDTTLGHHKWYNGKGGYPNDFDNTKSPKKILIDIVMLSDCMQAATEKVGRNYKGEKTFEMVMSEFRRDAGVMYNPDLVALIDAHPDLAEDLAKLINDGWEDIYYYIYREFFNS